MTQFRDVSSTERDKDSSAGRALPDGSFPIDNCSDLKNAIQAVGRAKDPGKAKAHIRSRKSSLGCPDVSLPDSWALSFDENGTGINHRDEAELAGVEPDDVVTPSDDILEDGITHAGFAVQAADTGRVLLIQRSLDQDDAPEVMGTWEFPGGGIEEGEDAQAAAEREFCEETGLPVPEGEVTGGWRSETGIYQGFVFTTPAEATAFPELNPDLAAAEMVNPDDPERRNPDVSAWFTLEQIVNLGTALRPEVHDTDWTQFTGGADLVGQTVPAPEEEAMTAATTEPEAVEPSEEPVADPADTGYIPWHGVIAVVDHKSGDGRGMTGMRQRPLPLPIRWQKVDQPGHAGSVVTSRLDQLALVGREVRGSGVILPTAEADDMVSLLAHFPRFGISVDGDDVTLAFDDEEGTRWYEGARVCGATFCPIPAFAEAWGSLGEAPEGFMDGEALPQDQWDNEQPPLVAAGVQWMAEQVEQFKRGPGWITNPEDTRRLHDYWTKPGEEGYAKVGWGAPGGGDFNRCRVLVGEELTKHSPDTLRFLNQICAQWHYDALGFWPGHAPTELASEPTVVAGTERMESFRVVERRETEALVAAAGLCAPAEWFENPQFASGDPRTVLQDNGRYAAPLTITPEGQVYGHIARWGVCHTGIPGVCREAPFSSTDYAYFRLGVAPTTEGDVPCGSLTISKTLDVGGHAPKRYNIAQTMAHYDNTCAAWADVNVGEDDMGIWCAGWVRPGTTPEMVVAAKASKVSGDWRPAGQAELEMVAALCVNSPGYPITRVHVAAGLQTSLVAAGVVQGEPNTFSEPLLELAREERRGKINEIAAAVEQRMIDRRETEALVAQLDQQETAALLARME